MRYAFAGLDGQNLVEDILRKGMPVGPSRRTEPLESLYAAE